MVNIRADIANGMADFLDFKLSLQFFLGSLVLSSAMQCLHSAVLITNPSHIHHPPCDTKPLNACDSLYEIQL